MRARQIEHPTGMQSWLDMVDSLRMAPNWQADDLPVELVHTHISVVLLGRRHVLKLKKPVDFGFLDYTTVENRRSACEAEVRLNRRLCPNTYLAVQPISIVSGQPRLSDAGPIIDYGVLMQRLPGDRMLDHLIARDEATEVMIDRVAERLCAFHDAADRSREIDRYGSLELIRQNWDENFEQMAPYVGRTIPQRAFETIRNWVDRWQREHQPLLRSRVEAGRIRDGHGDVRSESICVTNGICIFDCIEFNDRFRYGDVASEVAFLAMDLDARGRPDLGYYFAERCEKRSGDREMFELLPFYRCYRACVRGKVLSFRLDEADFSEVQKSAARSRARHYFNLARRYASRLQNPTVIVVSGLSGTGKTTLARSVAGELGLRVVSADAVRKSLFESGSRNWGYGQGPYSSEANRLTYERLIEMGRDLIRSGEGVVLDATFRRKAVRDSTREIAISETAEYRLIECRLPATAVRSRLERRAERGETLSDATWETYLLQRREFDSIDRSEVGHLALDTSGGLPIVARLATDWLRHRDHSSPVNPGRTVAEL